MDGGPTTDASGGGTPPVPDPPGACTTSAGTGTVPTSPCAGAGLPAGWTFVSDPYATCIDGSRAAYYLAPSSTGSKKWLIDLGGGGNCSDAPTCQHIIDNGNYTTCHGLGAPGLSGIFSRSQQDNPYLYDANIAFITYCSGDLWGGDRAGGADNGNFPIRGKRIIEGALHDLSSQLAGASEVVFGGQSAGGFGVLVNADRVACNLTALGFTGKYSALSDSGWSPGTPPQGAAAQAFWGLQPDWSCAAANPGMEYKCVAGPGVYPFLSSRTLVFIHQDDTVQMQNAGVSEGDATAMAQFATTMRDSFNGVGGPGTSVSAFAPNSAGHTVTGGTPTMQATVISGTSFLDYTNQWLPMSDSIPNLIEQP